MWRDADTGVWPEVDHDVAREQRPGHLGGVRHVERHRAAAPLRIAWGMNRVAAGIGKRDEP